MSEERLSLYESELVVKAHKLWYAKMENRFLIQVAVRQLETDFAGF